MSLTFGEHFAGLRRRLDVSLREFCAMHGFDAAYVSKIERGVLPPPASDEKLEEYASALKLVRGSDDWDEFVDLARLQRGEIPRDVLSDENAEMHLRVLFRTLRGKQVPDELLQEFIDSLRKL